MSDSEDRSPNGSGPVEGQTSIAKRFRNITKFGYTSAALSIILSVLAAVTINDGVLQSVYLSVNAVLAGAVPVGQMWIDKILVHPPLRVPDPGSAMRQRIDNISAALSTSVMSLGEASHLLVDLQEELTGRARALEKLRQEVAEHQKLAEISSEASKALDKLMETRMREHDRRIARVAWAQGVVFAIFGAAVAIAVVVFARWIPTLR